MDIIPKNGKFSGRPNGGMEAGIINGVLIVILKILPESKHARPYESRYCSTSRIPL